MDTQETPAAESVEQLAKRVFTELHQAILLNESGSFAGDIESIHDMRVAVRRLRVALSNFTVCLSKQDRKRLRSRMENLANALGNVRDLDVMIATIKPSLLARSDLEKSMCAPLIRRLRARRRFRLRALRTYLRSEEYAGFKQEFLPEPIHSETSPTRMEIPENPQKPIEPDVIEEKHGQAA
jgi:CHAD domain-containing protein